MSEDGKEVLLSRGGRTFRWGESHYFRAWSGLKRTFSYGAILKAIALPFGIAIAAVAYHSDAPATHDSRGVDTPTAIQNLPLIQAPILSGAGATNHLPQPKVSAGVIGRIKVFNLNTTAEIPAGSEARAVLESGASNGILKARLVAPLLVDSEPILPEGTTIVGRGKSTEERLFIEFSRAIFPSGESFPIHGAALDGDDKILGLRGALVGGRAKKMGYAVGFGVLGGMTEALENTSGNQWMMPERKSVHDAALSGASKAALDQSQASLEEMKNQPLIIEVKQGTDFYLMIEEPKEKEKE